MRNILGMSLALTLAAAAGLGCSTITEIAGGNTAVNVGVNANSPETMLRDKTGVAECDTLLDFITDQSKSKDDNLVTRAAKELIFNKIRQSLKESIDKNKNDKAKMAKECSDFKKQIDAQLEKDKNGNK